MFEVLDRVRKKSHEERQAIVLSIATIITGIIFIIWAISFFASIQKGQETVSESVNTFGFDSLVDSFQEARSTVGKEIETVQEQFEIITGELQNLEESRQTSSPTDVNAEIGGEEEAEVTSSGLEIIRIER